MWRKYTFLVIIGLVEALLLTSDTQAQYQDGTRGDGGTATGTIGGGGGAMGGFLGPGPLRLSALLSNENVHKELQLDDNQKTKVAEAVQNSSKEFSAALGESFTSLPRNLSPEKRQTVMLELMKNNQDKLLNKISKILLPEQFERLKELQIQFQGPMALSNPDIVMALNITSEQQDKIKLLFDAAKIKERAAMTGSQSLTSEERDNMVKELKDNLLNILTSDQRAQFEKMKGVIVDIGPSNFTMGGGSGDH